ncbi:MAG TPA: PaaI family thioesterase [Rhizomicrobium sp.]|jgi:uncharacterized protein (TIGR00369 family)
MAEELRFPEGAEDISTSGFNRFIGPLYRLPDGESGERRYCFPVADKHMNAAGAVHGGMLMAFLDISMSRTSRLESGAATCSTVSLACDFLAPGRLGDLILSRVRVSRRTRTMVFMSAETWAGDRLLLTAQGVWKVA